MARIWDVRNYASPQTLTPRVSLTKASRPPPAAFCLLLLQQILSADVQMECWNDDFSRSEQSLHGPYAMALSENLVLRSFILGKVVHCLFKF